MKLNFIIFLIFSSLLFSEGRLLTKIESKTFIEKLKLRQKPISTKPNDPGAPLILVPGDGGTNIEGKLTGKPYVVHYFCLKSTSYWFDLWLNLEALIPLVLDCWVDNLRLVYHPENHTTSNSPGVETRILDWGNTSTVEWIDPSMHFYGEYYNNIADNARSWGYTTGKNLRGAPFDFRKAPNEMADFFTNLTKLVEDTYYYNGNKKVVTVGHSLGNNYLLYFFNHKTQDWKDKFIKSHVSLGGPWGGSAKITRLLASGYNFDEWNLFLPALKIRIEQRSMMSSPFLLPTDKFWEHNETLITTPYRNYTTKDYDQFYKDINFDNGWLMYNDVKNLLYNLTAPGVEVHCLYGTGIETPERFIYGKDFPNESSPTQIYGDGDGTVNIRSLLGCLKWRDEQKQPVYNQSFPKHEHLKMLQSPDISEYIKKVVYK